MHDIDVTVGIAAHGQGFGNIPALSEHGVIFKKEAGFSCDFCVGEMLLRRMQGQQDRRFSSIESDSQQALDLESAIPSRKGIVVGHEKLL
jgi:hypothetical protein